MACLMLSFMTPSGLLLAPGTPSVRFFPTPPMYPRHHAIVSIQRRMVVKELQGPRASPHGAGLSVLAGFSVVAAASCFSLFFLALSLPQLQRYFLRRPLQLQPSFPLQQGTQTRAQHLHSSMSTVGPSRRATRGFAPTTQSCAAASKNRLLCDQGG